MEPRKTAIELTQSVASPKPTLIPTWIPTASPRPVQLSPTVATFNPSGSLLVLDGSDAIIMADIGSKSSVELTTATAIYAQPVMTKDGYVYYLSDQGASRGMLDVYRIKPSQKIPDRITYDRYFDFDLTSCYSQNIVAYTSDQHETNGTYNIDISGYDNSIRPRKILSKTQEITGLSCSPDGKYLAFFVPGDNGLSGDLYKVNIDGTNLSQLTQNNDSSTYSLSWSPDSQSIAFVIKAKKGDNLAVINVFDKTITELKNIETGLNIKAPIWSPDGTKVLFEAFNRQETKLKIINSDGTNEKVILDSTEDGGFFSYSAAWSPDSKYIAYAIRGNNRDKPMDLYILGLENGVQKQVLDEDFTAITSLSWVLLLP